MVRSLSITIGIILFASTFARSAGEGDCWCAKNVSVHHISQSECDAIGGTAYQTKQEALANVLMGLSNSDAFHTISAAAANKFHTDQGYEYAKKFADWISTAPAHSGSIHYADAVGHALETCASIPNTELHCDIVFLIAADGRIRRMLFGPDNRYTQCVSKNFRTSGNAPKPPADAWAMQIRLIDGVRPRYKGGDAPFLIFNQFWPPDRVNPR